MWPWVKNGSKIVLLYGKMILVGRCALGQGHPCLRMWTSNVFSPDFTEQM